ncbi:MAG: 3-isopropylmalate dehydrogenase, partial [Firmicutes bacterium]|nr:3-isopropylmalate dehydrogenase [Bacillota bacterium]
SGEADAIEAAIETVLGQGYRTGDIAAGMPSVGTQEMTDKIIQVLLA